MVCFEIYLRVALVGHRSGCVGLLLVLIPRIVNKMINNACSMSLLSVQHGKLDWIFPHIRSQSVLYQYINSFVHFKTSQNY